jgi:hypothetical protein
LRKVALPLQRCRESDSAKAGFLFINHSWDQKKNSFSRDSYTESNGKVDAHMRYRDIEWYAQDTWKQSRRLTLEYGIRFQRIAPSYGVGNTFSEFLPAAYAASKPAQLIQPVLVGGKRAGFDATTGQNVSAPLIGAYGLNSITYPGEVPLFEHVFHQPAKTGSSPAVLYAFDAVSGKELWNSGKSITSYVRSTGIWSSNAQVYVATHDSTVYAFGFAMDRHQ